MRLAAKTGMVLTFAFCIAAVAFPKEKVIHDADMGVFNDDAHALIMMLNSGLVDVLGITTVAGNSWVENCTAAAITLLKTLGRTDIPIIPGAGNARSLTLAALDVSRCPDANRSARAAEGTTDAMYA